MPGNARVPGRGVTACRSATARMPCVPEHRSLKSKPYMASTHSYLLSISVPVLALLVLVLLVPVLLVPVLLVPVLLVPVLLVPVLLVVFLILLAFDCHFITKQRVPLLAGVGLCWQAWASAGRRVPLLAGVCLCCQAWASAGRRGPLLAGVGLCWQACASANSLLRGWSPGRSMACPQLVDPFSPCCGARHGDHAVYATQPFTVHGAAHVTVVVSEHMTGLIPSVSQSGPCRPPGGVEEMQEGGRRVRLEWGAYITV
ncbi:hypothetical protein FHG87_018693 [Trinorchestia longiramus]|nr:hypothetical protein FHG87_018693 [Trinorchestia longiramus]